MAGIDWGFKADNKLVYKVHLAHHLNARTNIITPNRFTEPGEPEISFTDDCDGCGICVRACTYGALTREKRAEAA